MNKKADELVEKNSRCTGCGACENICAADAIRLDYDQNGFLKPIIEKELCVDCGLCVSVCPTLNVFSFVRREEPECYAAWAKDEFRMDSSSGGVFSVFAERVLKEGGTVFGAVLDSDMICRHIGIRNMEELPKLRHSKYVQGTAGRSYREVKEILSSGDGRVLYVGRPCQIAGLKSYLGKQIDLSRLILVDLLCFYAPSNQLFQKHIEEQYELQKISKVIFRDKLYGWNSDNITIHYKDGSNQHISSKEDGYLKMFQKVLGRNDVCEHCQFADFLRQGDITLGDFWGIERHDTSWNDGKGTSLVLGNTEKGRKFLHDVKKEFQRIEKIPLSWCLDKGNRIGTDGILRHPNEAYFEQLIKKKELNEAVTMADRMLYDIGVVCVFNHNYGNNLTNFALYSYLRDLGYFVCMIDVPKGTGLALPNDRNDRMELFQECPYQEIDFPKQVPYKEELVFFNEKCNVFLVGSDQLWRSMFVSGSDFYTCLDWVNDSRYKMSYGTSFGVNTFEDDGGIRKKFEIFLRRFQRISVREKSGCELLKNEFGLDSVHVLDPVLMCDRKHYERLADKGKKRVPKEKYIGAYILDPSEIKQKAIEKIAGQFCENRNMVIYDAMDHIDGKCREMSIKGVSHASVEEWLAMISDCDFFVTDSFHGVCVSLIFQKNFAVVFHDSWRGIERIQDILHLTGLEEHLLQGYDEEKLFQLYEKDIDYALVNQKLSRERKRSEVWLKEALEESKTPSVWPNNTFENYEEYLKKQCEGRHTLFLKKKELLDRKLKECETGEKTQVIGWGTGGSFRRNINKVLKYCDMRYVVDSKPSKWGKEFAENVTCISPEQLSQEKNVVVLIMVDSTVSAFQIVENLINIGISSFEYVDNYIKYIESLD